MCFCLDYSNIVFSTHCYDTFDNWELCGISRWRSWWEFKPDFVFFNNKECRERPTSLGCEVLNRCFTSAIAMRCEIQKPAVSCRGKCFYQAVFTSSTRAKASVENLILSVGASIRNQRRPSLLMPLHCWDVLCVLCPLPISPNSRRW